MYVCMYVCVCIYLSVRLSVYISAPVYLCICLAVYLVHLVHPFYFVNLSVCHICPSVYVCTYVCMDVHNVIMRSRPAAVQAAKDAAAELRGEPLGPRRVKARQDAGVAVRLFKRLRKVNAPGEKLKFFFFFLCGSLRRVA